MNNVWQRIKCAVLGHSWAVEGEHRSNIGAERNCVCGAHVPAVVWPKYDHSRTIPSDDAMLTWPGKAAGMPMPDIIWPNDKPAPTESIEALMLEQLKAIRAALEVPSHVVRNSFEIKSQVAAQTQGHVAAAAARGVERAARRNP